MTRLILHNKCVREMEARYGMRGVRVGEASHQGQVLCWGDCGILAKVHSRQWTQQIAQIGSEALLDELARDLLHPTHSTCSAS